MANTEQEFDLEDVAVLDEAKHKAKEEEGEEEEEEEEEEESSKKAHKGKKMDEETLAASSLHPKARPSDPMSKVQMMTSVMSKMHGMSKGDLTHWFNATMAQFGPGKDYGVGDKSAQNQASIDMKTGSGPKTKDPMPKLNVKEDIEEMISGQDISEEFK